MVTVKVCASMSAVPTTAEPLSKSVLKPPAVTEIGEWAGQNWSGIHCTIWLLSQLNCPVGVLLEVMVIDRSARTRLLTGSAKVTSIGAATPTTSPLAGEMAVTVGPAFGPGTAAIPAGAEPTMATAMTPATTSTYRTAMRNTSIPSPVFPTSKVHSSVARGGGGCDKP